MSDYESKTESELKGLRSQLLQKIQDFQKEIQKIDRCIERKRDDASEMTSMDILESIFPKMSSFVPPKGVERCVRETSMKSASSKKKEDSSDEEEEEDDVKPKKKTAVGAGKKKATAKAKESDSEDEKKSTQFGKLDTNKVTIDVMMKVLNKNKVKYDTSTTKLRADFCTLVKKNSLIMECVALQKKENEKK